MTYVLMYILFNILMKPHINSCLPDMPECSKQCSDFKESTAPVGEKLSLLDSQKLADVFFPLMTVIFLSGVPVLPPCLQSVPGETLFFIRFSFSAQSHDEPVADRNCEDRL